jgi:hypothetical protein
LPSVAGNGFYYFAGTETGSSFTDFLLGTPTFFAQESALETDERKNYGALFAQDSWRVRGNLVFNSGIRWELIQPYYERFNQRNTYVLGAQSVVFPTAPKGDLFPGDPLPTGGRVPRGIARTPLDNIAPRFGLAYSPSSTAGLLKYLLGTPGTMSIRASFGVFYSNIEAANTFFTDPTVPYLVDYTSPLPPLFESPLTSRTNGMVTSLPLPFVPPKPGQSVDFQPLLPLTGFPAVSIGNQTPYAEQYYIQIQRKFGKDTLLTVGYTGNQGHHLPAIIPINPGNPQLCLSLPGCGPGGEQGVYTLPNGTVVNGTRAPFGPQFGDDYLMSTIADSAYNSLTASLQHKGKRYSYLAAYTFSKSLDNASSSYTEQALNPFNNRVSRALSAFDMPQNFVISYNVNLPFDRIAGGQLARLTRSWQLVGIIRIASGFPVTLTEVDDRSLIGSSGSGIGNPVDVPDYNSGNLEFNAPQSGKPYFNTGLFTPEPLGQLGNSSRRFFHGPWMGNSDVSLLKDLPLKDKLTFQFRVEYFNLFNHTQFNAPDGNINDGAANFGFVHSAGDPRIGQLALRVLF